MTTTEVVVAARGVALLGALAWYFFAPRTAAQAQVRGGRQVVDITVKGGYSPNLIRVEAGTPVQLRFHRRENSDCTARVIFPDLRTSASLAAFGTTTLDLAFDEPGEYSWACGMNMLHGTLIAESIDGDGGLQAKAERAEAPSSAPEQGGEAVGEAARGVTQVNRETARAVAVGVGPRVEDVDRCARAEFLLPGALRSLPTDVVRAEAQLRAIEGVDSAQVNFGAERAVVMYDPMLVDVDGLTEAVATATGFPARLRALERRSITPPRGSPEVTLARAGWTTDRWGTTEWVKTFVVAVLGGLLTLAGIALLVLPGPGFVLVAAGLAVLATRFAWAKKPLEYAKDKAEQGIEEVGKSPLRAAGAAIAALVLIALGGLALAGVDLPFVNTLSAVVLIISGLFLIGTIFYARHEEQVEQERAHRPAGTPQGGGAYRAARPDTD